MGKVDRAQPGTDEGRYQVRPGTAPHPSGLRPATLSQERVIPPHPSRLRRATLSAGEGISRRGTERKFVERYCYD